MRPSAFQILTRTIDLPSPMTRARMRSSNHLTASGSPVSVSGRSCSIGWAMLVAMNAVIVRASRIDCCVLSRRSANRAIAPMMTSATRPLTAN